MPVTTVPGADIRDGSLTDADVDAANIDGVPATPSLRTLGTGAQQATAGNDARLSDDRTASGLRTSSTVVAIAAATAPSAGQVLTALNGTSADWQTPSVGLSSGNFVEEDIPTGTIDGVNAAFTLANTPTAGTLRLFKNGIRMRVGASEDFLLAGAVATFNAGAIPVATDTLVADYRI